MFLQGNCLEQQSMWRFIEIVGFIGGGLTVVMLGMRTMIPLRVVGIASNIFRIAFGALAGVTPMLIQHGVLLPVNAYRLFEQMRLVKQVREATAVDLSMDWLMPYMTKRRVEAGQILFHKGQAADEMFMVVSGRLRLSESALDVLPGSVVGGLGLLAPTSSAHKRSNVSKTPKSCRSVTIA
jgi:CRP/FNR family transcriptional regulator, cyclic AMP receptor protein